jgi:hypothetical protein
MSNILLELTSEEFLALYNLVQYDIDAHAKEQDSINTIKSVHHYFTNVILNSLDGKNEKIKEWLSQEEKRIAKLSDELKNIKEDEKNIKRFIGEGVVTLDDVPLDSPDTNQDYPRKGPSLPRPGNFGKKRKHR